MKKSLVLFLGVLVLSGCNFFLKSTNVETEPSVSPPVQESSPSSMNENPSEITTEELLDAEEKDADLQREVMADIGLQARWETSFAHTSPGVSSEVYSTIFNLNPGEVYELTMRDASGNEFNQFAEANSDGVARFTWTITSYGTYIILDSTGRMTESSKTVVVK